MWYENDKRVILILIGEMKMGTKGKQIVGLDVANLLKLLNKAFADE